MPTPETNSRWRIDRRIPLVLILAILSQTIGFGSWMGSFETRLARVISDVEAHETIATHPLAGERLARIEALLEAINDRLDRAEARKREGDE